MLIHNLSTRTITLRDVSANTYVVPAVGDLTVADALWSDTEFRRWLRYRARDLVIATATAGDAVSNAPGTTIQNTITAGSATVTPLILKGFASQTADLFQIQNSAAVVLGKWSAAGIFYVTANDVIIRDATTQRVFVGSVGGSNPGIALGSAADTNLYRSAAGVLQTDGSLKVGGSVRHTILTKTTTYTAVGSDAVLRADATGGAFTITLPAVSAASGQRIQIKKIDSSANAVTISRAGADTIEGATTISLATQWTFATLINDGTSVWLKF